MALVMPNQSISKISKAADPKQAIRDAVGDLDTVEVMQNMVLVATYIRPEKTVGGIIRPDSVIDEDIWQGKVGLVLKCGPVAFKLDEDDRFGDVYPGVYDWCVYRVGDAWELTLRGVACRLVADHNIRLIINDPEEIF